MIGRQYLAAEDRIAKGDLLGLGARLQQAPEAVGVLDGLDGLVPFRQGHVGVMDVMLAPDGTDEDGLAAAGGLFSKARKSYSKRVPGPRSVSPYAFAGLAHGGGALQEAERRVGEVGAVAVGIGHLARLQHAIVVAWPR